MQGLQLFLGVQPGVDAVYLCQQLAVVRHELVFAMRNVDGRQFQVADLKFVDEPFQRHRVPDDFARGVEAGSLNGLLHVVIAIGVPFPAALNHQVMAEAALVDDDPMAAQVAHRLDGGRTAFLVNHAVGEQVDDGSAIEGKLVVEVGIHAQHEVRPALLQVAQGFVGGFQVYGERNVEPLENHGQQVDVVAYGLSLLVQEGVWPKIPRVFIDERVPFVKFQIGIVVGLYG